MPDIHIFVSEIRNSQWPRFVIQDSWHRVWTGSKWSYDRTKARLFCDQREASQAVSELVRDNKVRMFSTAVKFTSRATKDFPLMS